MKAASQPRAAVVAPQIPSHNENLNVMAGSDPAVLADIYEPKTNITIWQRSLSESLQCLVDEVVASQQQPYIVDLHSLRCSMQLQELGSSRFSALVDDVNELIDMFCYLLTSTKLVYA